MGPPSSFAGAKFRGVSDEDLRRRGFGGAFRVVDFGASLARPWRGGADGERALAAAPFRPVDILSRAEREAAAPCLLAAEAPCEGSSAAAKAAPCERSKSRPSAAGKAAPCGKNRRPTPRESLPPAPLRAASLDPCEAVSAACDRSLPLRERAGARLAAAALFPASRPLRAGRDLLRRPALWLSSALRAAIRALAPTAHRGAAPIRWCDAKIRASFPPGIASSLCSSQ